MSIMPDGIKKVAVLDGRNKLVVIPGCGATTARLDYSIAVADINEITIRDTDYDYIRKYSVSKRYEGDKRETLIRHLSSLGWKPWSLDHNIWLHPNHKQFNS